MARRPPTNPFGTPFGPGGPGFEALGDIHIPRPPRRFWIGLAFVAAAIFLIIVAEPIVTLITNAEWFSALGFGGAYATRVELQLFLFAVGFLVPFLFTVGNVVLVLRFRTSGKLRAVGIKRRTLRSRLGVAAMIGGAILALILAFSLTSFWTDLALFMHPQMTGQHDPVLGADLGFYLTQLPFLGDVQSWLVGLLVVVILLTYGLHSWHGDHIDLRLQPRGTAHVSVLIGIFGLVVAFGAWLSRYGYVYGHDSAVWGAGFTDIHARLPLTTAQVVLAVLLSLALIANAASRLRRFRWIVIAVAIWIAAAIVVAIYPALVQRLSVQPAELSQEQPYIAREIAGTRQAYDLSKVQLQQYSGTGAVTSQAVANDQTTISNLRLWDTTPLQNVYQQQQAIRTYYTFQQIGLDRYTISGNYQQVEISPREMDQSQLPPQAQTWVNQRLVYTHGYGVVASPVSAVDQQGLPQYVAQNIPNTGPLAVAQPQIYFGGQESSWVAAPSAQAEFDYPNGSSSGNATSTWTGTDAPQLNGTNRLLWSMRTGDLNLLISDQIQSRSRILYLRNIQARVGEIAPFLTLDNTPYLSVVNGKLYWIEDAYTTSDNYPYAESGPTLPSSPGLSYNYIRNSVKVVVDAYTGKTTLFVAAPNDPLIKAYSAAFPSMFKPLSQMPTGLVKHIRVPQDYFNVQAQMYSTYHMTDPRTFYNREDVYSTQGITPYYVMMRLPGEPKAEYLEIQPYTPLNKNNMVAWLAVRQDAPHYGQTIAYVLPRSEVIFGPSQVQSRINQDPTLSQQYSLLNAQNSKVLKGNLLVVPIGGTFLYFEPWYIESQNGQSLPELKYIILTGSTSSSAVVYDSSLNGAISKLTGQAPPSSGPSPPSAPSSPQIQQLVKQALQAYQQAQADLKQGDLAGYATQMQQVATLLQQIQQASGQGTGTTPSPSPGASGAATPMPQPSLLPGIQPSPSPTG
ncbi:MAG: UPF0182 family protein [Candidatus Dormiibacterota bacterium]